MSLLRGGIKDRWGGEWVIRLLLLSFALRALVPLGYMPDFHALSQGTFKVVICTASGSKTLEVDSQGKILPATPGKTHNDQPCAFTGLAALNLPQLDIVTFEPVLADDAPLMAPLAVTLPPVRAGPILGSRGPPSHS